MLGTIDPLLFLRDNIQKNKPIYRDKDSLVFEGDIHLKLDTPTALVQSQSKQQYTIGSLWLYLKFRSESFPVYFNETVTEGLDSVIGLDKEKIQDFFFNNIDNIELIDNDLRPQTLIFLGKKKRGDPLNDILNKESDKHHPKSLKLSQSDINQKNSEAKPTQTKKNAEDINPSLLIIDYLYCNEKKSLNRNSMMKPINNVHSFEGLLSFSKRIFTKSAMMNKINETVSFLDELAMADDLGKNRAIIVVPSSYIEGNICFENAREFLENAKYINIKTCTDEEREACNQSTTQSHFSKKINDKELTIDICSNVRGFKTSDWKKIIAVFVQGDDWEFKDWPKDENVTTILQKVRGFYLKYKDLPANDNVKKWNVKVLEISRTQRHFDVSIQNEFWQTINEFLSQPRYRSLLIK